MGHTGGLEDEEKNINALFSIVEKTLEKAPQTTPDQTRDAMRHALDAGYRHIDTAALYQNEAEIGEVLQEYITAGKLKLEDFYIVTKFAGTQMAPERVPDAVMGSLKRLKLDYVDFYLIHSPMYTKFDDPKVIFSLDANGEIVVDHGTTLEATWQALEPFVENNKSALSEYPILILCKRTRF